MASTNGVHSGPGFWDAAFERPSGTVGGAGTSRPAEPGRDPRNRGVDRRRRGPSPDVDLVVGHHAHVVQPIQRRPDGRWVIYGLGNLLAQQVVYPPDLTPPHRDGVIVTVRVEKNAQGRYAVTRVGYVPTFVDAPSDVVELAPPFSAKRTVAIVTEYHAPVINDTPR